MKNSRLYLFFLIVLLTACQNSGDTIQKLEKASEETRKSTQEMRDAGQELENFLQQSDSKTDKDSGTFKFNKF